MDEETVEEYMKRLGHTHNWLFTNTINDEYWHVDIYTCVEPSSGYPTCGYELNHVHRGTHHATGWWISGLADYESAPQEEVNIQYQMEPRLK